VTAPPVAQVDRWRGREGAADAAAAPPLRAPRELCAVQTGAALLAGCTSATLTNPLDVIKTRLQARAPSPRAHMSMARRMRSGPGLRGRELPGLAKFKRWMLWARPSAYAHADHCEAWPRRLQCTAPGRWQLHATPEHCHCMQFLSGGSHFQGMAPQCSMRCVRMRRCTSNCWALRV